MFVLLSVPNLVTKFVNIILRPPEKSEIGRRSKLPGFHEKCDKVGDTLFVLIIDLWRVEAYSIVRSEHCVRPFES